MIKKRQTTQGARYDVRLRSPDGRVYNRTSRTKREAERYEATERADRARGAWLDPRHAETTFADAANYDCVVTNTYEPQHTTVYTGDGASFELDMAANEIRWYEI